MIFLRFFGPSSRMGGTLQARSIDSSNYNIQDNEIYFYDSMTDFNASTSYERSNDSSNLTRELGILIQTRLSSYWSTVKTQVNNYCDDLKRKLMNNLQDLR